MLYIIFSTARKFVRIDGTVLSRQHVEEISLILDVVEVYHERDQEYPHEKIPKS